jgi:hypothetical protein
MNVFDEPTWLHAPGLSPLRVEGWVWEARVTSAKTQQVIGAGGLAAELVLRTEDGSVSRMFTHEDSQAWTFDGKDVVPRS